MLQIVIFILFIMCIISVYLHYCASDIEPLHKYYIIKNRTVYAKMNIPAFTDLGIITVHTIDVINRVRDNCDNDIMYSDTIPWKRHRELGKYIKHSEYPNCEIYNASPTSFGIRTIRVITKGDEINADYFPLQIFYNSDV